MATPRPDLAQLSDSLFELIRLERQRLRDWEELAYRQGLSPGTDVSFAGVRLLVERTNRAHLFLRELVPLQDALYAWLDKQSPVTPQLEPASLGHS